MTLHLKEIMPTPGNLLQLVFFYILYNESEYYEIPWYTSVQFTMYITMWSVQGMHFFSTVLCTQFVLFYSAYKDQLYVFNNANTEQPVTKLNEEVWWFRGSVPASGPPGPGSNLGPGPPHSVVWGAADHTVILYEKYNKNPIKRFKKKKKKLKKSVKNW